MKIAICYDNLYTKGGHEKVVLTLTKAFNADVYTIRYEPEETFPEFKNLRVFTNELKYNLKGLVLIETIFRFRGMNLSSYDVIITSGGWSNQIAVNEKSPPVIDYNPGIPGFCKFLDNNSGILFRLWLKYIRKLDAKAVEKVDRLIANSYYVRNLLSRFYRRDAYVVYPPVDIQKFRGRDHEDFFLSVQRFSPQKNIELQIEVFKRLPDEKLVIIGSTDDTEYFYKLKRMAPKNVEFTNDENIVDLYSRCKGVLQTSTGEGFGMIAVEAMASGKPCLAVNHGGFRETIIHGKTGLLIDPPYIDNFVKAIKEFNKYTFDPRICQERAKEFSEQAFIKKMETIIKGYER